MKIVTKEDKAHILTPYNYEFVKKIKRIRGARWDAEDKAWVVNAEYISAVREIMCDVYGESDISIESKRYNVKITFKEDYYCRRHEAYFFGKCLAYSHDQDNNAKIGKGVCYLEGGCTFVGSAKSWMGRIEKGTVAMVYDVPETLLEKEEPIDGIEFEFIRRRANKTALKREKEGLLARIAEIDTVLQTRT